MPERRHGSAKSVCGGHHSVLNPNGPSGTRHKTLRTRELPIGTKGAFRGARATDCLQRQTAGSRHSRAQGRRHRACRASGPTPPGLAPYGARCRVKLDLASAIPALDPHCTPSPRASGSTPPNGSPSTSVTTGPMPFTALRRLAELGVDLLARSDSLVVDHRTA